MSAHVWERMSAYIDRELPQTERAGVEAHLRECAKCARAIEEMRAVDVLARGHEVQAPAGYFDGLPTRLRARLSPRSPARVAPWMLALAAGLAVAVLTPLALREGPSPLPQARAVPARPAAPSPAAIAAIADPPPAAFEPGRAPVSPPAFRAPAIPSQRPDGLARRERGDAEKVNVPTRKEVEGEGRLAAAGPADAVASAPPTVGASTAGAPSEGDAAGQEVEAEDDAPLVSDNSGPERESSARTASAAARSGATRTRPADARFRALAGRAARSAAEARALRDAWQAYVRDDPEGPHADEARVGALEAGAAAWRLGGLREDRAQVEKDGREYLRRPEATDKERVRALLAGLEP